MTTEQLCRYGRVHPFEDQYVSQAITESTIKIWDRDFTLYQQQCFPQTGKMIYAPTGRGKNHFVETVLIPHAYQTNKNILIITNRTALDQQIKSRLENSPDWDCSIQLTKRYLSATELKDVKLILATPRHDTCYNHPLKIYIVTYHNLVSLLKTSALETDLRFCYAIFDEVHFFTADSLFNPHTGYILFQSVAYLKKLGTIRIYMTATPENIIGPLHKLDSLDIYHFPHKAYNYQCHYFYEQQELIPHIQQSGNQEQWLIFTNSKAAGKTLRNQLVELLGSEEVAYIDSRTKHTSVWKQITTQSCYLQKVLICTGVLDNGVNLSEDSSVSARNVRHIVIPHCEHDIFIQRLGRKRIPQDATFPIHLYLQAIDRVQLNSCKRHVQTLYQVALEWCDRIWGIVPILTPNETPVERLLDFFYNENGSPVANEFYHPSQTYPLMRKLWRKQNNMRQMFQLIEFSNNYGRNKEITLSLNLLAIDRLYAQKHLYDQLESLMPNMKAKRNYTKEDSLSAFPKLAMQWLSLSYEHGNWIYSPIEELARKIIKAKLGYQMSQCEFDAYANEILEEYLALPRAQRKGMNIKHDGKNNKSDLNKILSNAKPTYLFKKRKNIFLLELETSEDQ